jgi:hypothetical protein
MRGILIDPSTKTVSEIFLPKDHDARRKRMNLKIGCIQNTMLDGFDNGDIICGDIFGSNNVENLAFTVKESETVFFGRSIVLGYDLLSREEISPKSTVTTLRIGISFFNREETEKRRALQI